MLERKKSCISFSIIPSWTDKRKRCFVTKTKAFFHWLAFSLNKGKREIDEDETINPKRIQCSVCFILE